MTQVCIAEIPGLATTWKQLEKAIDEAKLDEILQSKTLGGHAQWKASDFITEARFDELGGLHGVGKHAWYALRNLSCVTQKVPKEDWNKYKYTGRGGLTLLKPGEYAR